MYLPQVLIGAAVKRTRRGKIPAVPGSLRGHVGDTETSLFRRVGPCLPAPFRKTGDNRPGSFTFMAVPLLRENIFHVYDARERVSGGRAEERRGKTRGCRSIGSA